MKRRLFRGLMLITILAGSTPGVAQTPGESLVDPRDGRQYNTVQIGEQVWMAENLNFGDEQHSCYDRDPSNCEIYGGLYRWEVALNVCPEGWHLPSRDEWETLIVYLGEKEAGQKLKATSDDPNPWDGTNESGFTALSGGAGNGEGFHRRGDWALFWTSSEFNRERAWFTQLDGFWYPAPPKYKNLYVGWYYLKSNQFSVRCVRNQDH